MNEKFIEHHLTVMVKAKGGIAAKFVSPSFAGMPDRLVLLPGGVCAFAELKAPGMDTASLTVFLLVANCTFHHFVCVKVF